MIKKNNIIIIAICALFIFLGFYFVFGHINSQESFHSSSPVCNDSTEWTAWEVYDRRIACRNEAEYYLWLVEKLKEIDEIRKCEQTNSCKGLE